MARQSSSSLGLHDNELLLFGCGFQVVLDASQMRHARVDREQKMIHYAKDLLDKELQHRW